MAFDRQQRRAIYDRTDGHCHICYIKLSFENYGIVGGRAAWEVEHSRPRVLGGTHHGNNLYAACIPCNREKSAYSTRTARRWNGTAKAPHSKAKKRAIRKDNATAGAVVGGTIGLIGGPIGVALGALIGHHLGHSIKPPKA